MAGTLHCTGCMLSGRKSGEGRCGLSLPFSETTRLPVRVWKRYARFRAQRFRSGWFGSERDVHNVETFGDPCDGFGAEGMQPEGQRCEQRAPNGTLARVSIEASGMAKLNRAAARK
jgi:hypothetical protein